MKYYELDLINYVDKNGEIEEDGRKTYKLRLTSSNAIALEKVYGKSIVEIMEDISITTIVKLLEYMGKDNDHNFGYKEASSLYDQLIANDYTLESIITDVIYEVLVLGGFLKREELEKVKQVQEKAHKKIDTLIEN